MPSTAKPKKPATGAGSAPATNAANSKAGTLKPPSKGVAVRMYRQGLGDSFLLAFSTGKQDEAFYMLIDCGVILGTKSPGAMMDRVVKDINAATNGHIHLLIVTHEHWDHVSGFLQAEDAFKGLKKVHNVWFAWTEDPKDDLANQLRKDFDNELGLLRKAVGLAVNHRSVEYITNLLGFFGVSINATEATKSELLGVTGSGDTRAAMKAAAALCSTDPKYHLPGTGPLPLPKIEGSSGIPGVRIYILGPPHNEKTLKRINPTKKGKEVYKEESTLTPRKAFLSALLDAEELSEEGRDLQNLCYPFDSSLRISKTGAQKVPFFRDNYGFEHYRRKRTATAKPKQDKGAKHPAAWRRIDDDWLGMAGELALKLDSYTNNTSLVLAIEFVDSGRVLLFAADAQVGNWLSWDDYTWQVKGANGATKNVQIGDLLQRTVLYKVGHHGSHNATVRGVGEVLKGLELMSHEDLAAMIPVNHEMAVTKGWEKMPFEPLLRRLEEKTARRIMRIDDSFPKPKPDRMSQADWKLFKKNFSETELYMQYDIHDQ